MFIHSVWSYFN